MWMSIKAQLVKFDLNLWICKDNNKGYKLNNLLSCIESIKFFSRRL